MHPAIESHTKRAFYGALVATLLAALLLVNLGVLWTPVEQIAAVSAGVWTFIRLDRKERHDG